MEINETLYTDPYITPFVNDYLGVTSASNQTDSQSGIDVNPSNTVEYIPVVYGYRQVTGIRLYTYVVGNDLYVAYALSEGYCRGIDRVYIDDNLIDCDYPNLTHRNIISRCGGAYAGLLSLEFIDGRGTAHRNSVSGAGSSSLLSLAGQTVNYANLAYLVCKFTYNGQSTPYKDVPKVSVNMFGRIMPEFTGATANTYSTNPVDVVWDILQHPTYGKNIDKSFIDDTSFTAVKNYCNADITRQGFTYDTFTTNWVMDTSRSTFENLQTLLETYNITLNYTQARWVLSIEALTTANPVTFNESNIISDIEIHYPSVQEKYNRVFVTYQDKDNNFATRTQTYPAEGDNSLLTADSNIVLENRISNNLITDSMHANDLAQMMLRKSRSQLIYKFTATKIALQCVVGDTAYINTTYPYINNQSVKIINLILKPDMTVELECALYSTGFYPPTFSNQVKFATTNPQAVQGTIGVLTNPITTPILPPEPSTQPTYSVFPNRSILNEGDNVVFTIFAPTVGNGTVINYELGALASTTLTTNDVNGESLTGTVTIQNGRASKTFTLKEDLLTESVENYYFRIRLGNSILATTQITVQDTSVTPRYDVTFSNTASVQYALISDNDFYIEKYPIGSTGSTFAEGDREIVVLTTPDNYKVSALRIRFILHDRRNGLYKNYDLKYITYDVISHPTVQVDSVLCGTLAQHSYAKNNVLWWKFDYNNPPVGANANRSTRERPTPIQFDEYINYSVNTGDTPGAPTFNRTVTPQYTYTYYSEYFYVPLRDTLGPNWNTWSFMSRMNPRIFTVRTAVDVLASSGQVYSAIKFRFWGTNRSDGSFREVATTTVNLAATSSYISTNRLVTSNAALRQVSGRTTNYW